MGKYKMPNVQQFLRKKKIYDDKKEPVWVYLEREMIENSDKKPYNQRVGQWLKFLRDLRYYYYCEAKRKLRRLENEVGPPWYCELSTPQREVLDELKFNIHQDLLEDVPSRTRKSLSDLGLTCKIPTKVLMEAMKQSVEDPGLFMWELYSSIYRKSPSELQPKYDMNAMILMSSLVFIDLEECVKELEKLTYYKSPPTKPKTEKKKKYYEPKIRYGVYLQKMYVTPVPEKKKVREQKPKPLGNKLRLRSANSYERICLTTDFLKKRKERNQKEKLVETVCNYKFWEPPSTLRNTDPKMAAYVNKLKMIKKKAKVKFSSPFKNVQYHISGVSFTGGTPNYTLANVALLPTGYIPINGGIVCTMGDYITTIIGYWKYPNEFIEKCDSTCDCLTKWEPAVMQFLQQSKCKCGHLYDYYHQGKATEKYFYPPNKYGPYWMDYAKVYQMDPTEDFIKDTIRDAIMSGEQTPEESEPTLSAEGLKERELLAAFLADISDTPLIIPHLPKANLLNNLQEWVRRRVKGNIDPKTHKNWALYSERRWLDLKHIDFRARAYRIPFTLKQLKHMNWNHRGTIMKLFHILLEDFVSRNRVQQLEQTRLWWPTTKFDAYPSKAFLDIFFTYMPGRMKDTFLIDPYSSERTPKYGAKTCPLSF